MSCDNRNNINQSSNDGDINYNKGVIYSDGSTTDGLNNGNVGEVLTSTGTSTAPVWALPGSFPGIEGIIYNNGVITTTIPTSNTAGEVLVSNGLNPIWQPAPQSTPPGVGLFYSPDGTTTQAITNGPNGSFLKMVSGNPAFSIQGDGLITSKAGQLSNVTPGVGDSICINNASGNFFMIPISNGLIRHTNTGFNTLSTSGTAGDICVSNNTGTPIFVNLPYGSIYRTAFDNGVNNSGYNSAIGSVQGQLMTWDNVNLRPTFNNLINGMMYGLNGTWNYIPFGNNNDVLQIVNGVPAFVPIESVDIPDPLLANNIDEKILNTGVNINNNITVFNGIYNGIRFKNNQLNLGNNPPSEMNTYISGFIPGVDKGVFIDSETLSPVGSCDVYVHKIGGLCFVTISNLLTSNLLNNASYISLSNFPQNGDFIPKSTLDSNMGIVIWKSSTDTLYRNDVYVHYDKDSRLFSFRSVNRSDFGYNAGGKNFTCDQFTFSWLGQNN